MKNMIQAAVVTLFAASAAHAQQAVQWKVSDGGNGHWYEYVPTRLRWPDAKQAAGARNGYLACLASADESSFVRNLGVEIAHLGGFQAPGVCEPNCGWQWLSGEPWSYTRWAATQPDNGSGVEHVLEIDLSGTWNDYDATAERNSFIIEWSADCDGDGIVDYGQCYEGTLPDYNGNNIPDCCERGEACVPNMVVNGSFELGTDQPCGWVCLETGDARLPGWEITLNSVDRERTEPGGCNEGWFASHGNYSLDMNGCSVGGKIRQMLSTVPGTTYLVSFDLSLNPTIVAVGRLRVTAGSQSQDFEYQRKPTGTQPNEHHEMQFTAIGASTALEIESLNREYSSQWCGPILDAVRVVPSEPQQPTCVDADIYRDFNVNGADLGILLSQWGPNTPLTESDLNKDGFVNGADLGIMLSFWGACP